MNKVDTENMEMNNVVFTQADAQQLYERIPGPYFDGTEWYSLLVGFQEFLEAQGDDETVEEMDDLVAFFEEASSTVHCGIYEALKKYRLMQ